MRLLHHQILKSCGIISLLSILLIYICALWTNSRSEISTIYQIPPTRKIILPENSETFPVLVEQQDWQPVKGSKKVFGVYSAYSILNRRPPKLVVIGAKRKSVKEKIYCQYYFARGKPTRRGNVSVEKARFRGKLKTLLTGSKFYFPNAGVLVTCPLPITTQYGEILRPEMVSVMANNEAKPSNQLKIQYLNESKASPYQYNFSVCVKPTFNFSQSFHLLEWIEFYKMMGVQQFTFYNMTIGPEASCILNKIKNGMEPSIKMNILPWTIHPILNDSIITEHGNVLQYALAAAQNDCVYRHRGHLSKYMVFVDLDEFIMPREGKGNNLAEMISLLNSHHPKMKIGEYQFKNGFFSLSRPNDRMLHQQCSGYRKGSLKYKICLESYLMTKSIREEYNKFNVRSKYIIMPERVVHTSTHYVDKFEKGFKSLHVSEKIAFSRHYRNNITEGTNSVWDGVSHKFSLKFVNNLSRAVKYFAKTCNLRLDHS